ncbi:DUF6655 family protein [Rhodospirillaceae bacterium SYSU D60014]|uniref:DUF6655 family protein n=1 Tax=Virgifigura deserti TaxID=2268457 RepID=UPI0013C4758D
MLRTPFLLLPILAPITAGCSGTRRTEPSRTATEQLLISAAVDHALDGLDLGIPQGTKLWVDARYFESIDRDYAVGAIRNHLLREGGRLVNGRAEADAVVEIRSGALSTDRNEMFVGIPSVDLPIPLVENASTPELGILKKNDETGVAKIGMTIYEMKTGALAPYSPAAPAYGFSDRTRWVVLSLISWTNTDVMPEDVEK